MTKIIVIKVGSCVLLTRRDRLDEFRIANLASQIAALKELGFSVVLIVSGAVACGSKVISLESSLARRAASGIGQIELINTVSRICQEKKISVSQILLTVNDINDDFKAVVEFYLDHGVIPVLNENDVIALNCFGGNDFLAVRVASLLNAQQVLMLSTMEGSGYGVGGRDSKLEAVRQLRNQGIKTNIVDGKRQNVIIKSII